MLKIENDSINSKNDLKIFYDKARKKVDPRIRLLSKELTEQKSDKTFTFRKSNDESEFKEIN